MPQCSVCRHPDHLEIERRLAKKEITQTKAGELLSSPTARIDQSTISRHLHKCVPARIASSVRPRPPTIAHDLNCVNILTSSHDDLRELFEEARANGDLKNALKALEVEIRQVHEIASLTGQTPTEGPQFTLFMMDPLFITFKRSILAAVSDHPEVKGKISAALRSLEPEDVEADE